MNLFSLLKRIGFPFIAILCVSACGQKGPLMLPPKDTTPLPVRPIIFPNEENAHTDETTSNSDHSSIAPTNAQKPSSIDHGAVSNQADSAPLQKPLSEKVSNESSQITPKTLDPTLNDPQNHPIEEQPYQAVEHESSETPLGILPSTQLYTPVQKTISPVKTKQTTAKRTKTTSKNKSSKQKKNR